jgi:pSer/pThr/pTyr-binding forkhead associated (FHA) protein
MLSQSTMLSARTRAAPVLVRKSGGAPLLCLEGLITVIGSRRGSELRLASPEVSGAHAIILNRGGEVYVHDLLSRSGVFVNDEPVRQPRALRHEDEVRVGPFAFQFQAEDDGVLRRSAPGSRAGQPAFLSVEDRLEAVRIDGPLFVIGRRRGADLMVAENSVSSAHAVIVECDGRRFIRDLNSRTGTRVNGERCRQQEISSGDVIRVGKTQFRYQTLTPGDLDDASAMADADVTRLGNPDSVNPDSSLFGQNLAEGDRALPTPQPPAATQANRSQRGADAESGPGAHQNDGGGRAMIRTAAQTAQQGSDTGSPPAPGSPGSLPPPAGRVAPPAPVVAPAVSDTLRTAVLFGGTQFGGLLDPRLIGGTNVVVTRVPGAGAGSPEWQPHARTVILSRPPQQNDGGRPNHSQAAVPMASRPLVESPAVQPPAPLRPSRIPPGSEAVPEPANAPVRPSDDTKAVTATTGSPASIDGTSTAGPRRAASAAASPEQAANARRERKRAHPAAAAAADRVDLNLVKGWGALAMATADCELLVHAAASRRFSRQQLQQPPAVYPSHAALDDGERAPAPASSSSLRWFMWGGAAIAFLVLAALGGCLYWARHGHPGFFGLH